jgi:sugar lactone lactonase YvrE
MTRTNTTKGQILFLTAIGMAVQCMRLRLGHLEALFCLLLVFFGGLGGPSVASAVDLSPGDLIVTDQGGASGPGARVLRIDPATGVQTTIAEGTGVVEELLWTPWQVAVEPSGQILVLDKKSFGFTGADVIIRIDPATGQQEMLTQFGLRNAVDLAVDEDGQIFAVLQDREYSDRCPNTAGCPVPSIVRIDPATGTQSTVASADPWSGLMELPQAIAADRLGNLIVADGEYDWGARVIRVGPDGSQTLISDLTSELESRISYPLDVALDVNGDYLVLGVQVFERSGEWKIVRVNPTTRAQTLVVGRLFPWTSPHPDTIAVDEEGTIFAVNYDRDGAASRIDPTTGEQQTVSSGLTTPRGIAVVPDLSSAIQESGTLKELIDGLKDLAFGKYTYDYVRPSSRQFDDFKALAGSVANGQLAQAVSEAQALGYELVLFTDTRNGKTYRVLREKLDGSGQQSLGWGNYVYDPSAGDYLIEAPHPLNDSNTPELAIQVFYEAGAKGYLMAGAHRLTNGGDPGRPTSQPANVAGDSGSAFQAVHEAWSGSGPGILQIHGFALSKHQGACNTSLYPGLYFPAPCFPNGTRAVLSDGDANVSFTLAGLDAELDDRALLSFVWNEDSSLDTAVNCANGANSCRSGLELDGRRFGEVGGNYNVQGKYSRDSFLHVELESAVRIPQGSSNPRWDPAVDALVAVVGGGCGVDYCISPPDPDDEEAPICNSTGSGSDRIVITVQDELSGLAEIRVGRSRNVDVEVPNFERGTTEPVQVTALIENPDRPDRAATVVLKNTDEAGNGSTCRSAKRPPRRRSRRSR